MKHFNKILFIYLIIIFSFLQSNIHYSHKGYFDLGTIHRLSDGSIIKIPYRMATYESITKYADFSLISNAALEFRLKQIDNPLKSELKFDLRELYVEWMTSHGDFSIGKQIISWGSASANNPSDNI